MSEFEIGRTYKPRYGGKDDIITIVDKDDTYIYFTKEWVQNKVFREKYIKHPNSETALTNVWTSSNDSID
jgi:hypothetical protein